jgi:hypothetical protein
MNSHSRLRSLALLSVMFLLPWPARGQSGERLSDNDVKEVIEAVDHGRDRFEDQLDGRIKNATLRGPRGEVKIQDYLQDLQDNVSKLKERFDKNYSAGAEVTAVLRQGSDIHNYFTAQAADIKGRSEWDRLALDLSRLADAYGTTFPLPADAAVRRINDSEAAAKAEAIAKQADVVKKAVGQDNTLAKTDRDAFKRDLDDLKKQANTVKDRASDSKPATAETRQLLSLVNKIDSSFQGKPAAASTLAAWGGMRAPLDTLGQAYRLTR